MVVPFMTKSNKMRQRCKNLATWLCNMKGPFSSISIVKKCWHEKGSVGSMHPLVGNVFLFMAGIKLENGKYSRLLFWI
jgi:hypothetical protein